MKPYRDLLSHTVSALEPSGIRKYFDLLDSMEDVISLTVGQPDFITPWHIRVAGIESLEAGRTYYTSNSGLLSLRESISNYLHRRFGLSYDPKSEITVTVGGSEAIDAAVRAITDPGDEIIIPVPCFVCYEPIVRMAGGTPVLVETTAKDSFKLTAEALRAAITDKTKLLILPFPNNPTGAILDRSDLESIAEVLRGTDILVLSDEIYAELTYGKRHVSIASVEGMRERTVIASGFSKSYAMTGWRLGYVCAPTEISREIFKVHQYAIMCAPTTSQYAAIEALDAGDGDIEMMRSEYDRRRRYIVDGLNSIGLRCFSPEGAFYVWPYIGGAGMGCEKFCERLLYEAGVAIVPGTAFGACGEGYARISYAYSVAHIDKALKKIKGFTESL